MFNFSKPITMIGAAALVLYVIVFATTGIAFFTFLMTYSYASSMAGQMAPAPRILTTSEVAAIETMQMDATEQAGIIAFTPLPLATLFPTKLVESTPTPEVAATELGGTQTANETEQTVTPTPPAEDAGQKEMATIIQSLYNEGVIQTLSGTYHPVPNYEDSWNQVDWYRWTYVEYPAADFVIHAKASWETTSWGAMSQNSGCGFVFREGGPDNHYLMYLGINGRVYFYRTHDGKMEYIGNSVYYPIEAPSGEADIMLVAAGNRFYFYVNGDYLYDPSDGYFQEGKLGLTVLTGTAQDFGTRCKMEDIGLWVIK
jgi:hypothetical protein